MCSRGRSVGILKIKHGLEPRYSDRVRVVPTEIELTAAAPRRAPGHRGDPEAGPGVGAVRGRPLSHTE